MNKQQQNKALFKAIEDLKGLKIHHAPYYIKDRDMLAKKVEDLINSMYEVIVESK